MAKMSDKTKRAINKGRRKAGLKPIKFGPSKKSKKITTVKKSKFDEKAWRKKVKKVYEDLDKFTKNAFKGKSDADLRRIIRTKKGNTDDEGHELTRRMHGNRRIRDEINTRKF